MMTYPDRRHGIEEKRNTRLHLFTLLTDYLDQHLRDGELR
jgi:dipeptidyl-peptidase-4